MKRLKREKGAIVGYGTSLSDNKGGFEVGIIAPDKKSLKKVWDSICNGDPPFDSRIVQQVIMAKQEP